MNIYKYKMNIYLELFLITLILAAAVKSEIMENSHCANSKMMNEQCSSYCYSIVKPLLKYSASIHSKETQFDELKNKIQTLEATIKTLEKQLEICNEFKKNYLTREDLFASRKVILDTLGKDLSFCRNETVELNTKVQKRDAEISSLKAQTESNTIKIEELEKTVNEKKTISNAVNIIESEKNLSKNMDSCIGKSTGVHSIKVMSSSFYVYCDSTTVDSGWMVIFRSKKLSSGFDHDWNDYRKGFGDLHGEFFIGLDRLHLLTNSRNHELYVSTFENSTFARYSHFLISGIDDDFQIKSLGKYSGNKFDIMIEYLNRKFITPDKENSVIKTYCTRKIKLGWWLNSWSASTEIDFLFSGALMMIKPTVD